MQRRFASVPRTDLIVAAVIGIAAQVKVWTDQVAGPRPVVIVLFLLVGFPLAVRRQAPVLAAYALFVALIGQALVSSHHAAEGLPLVLALLVTMYSVGAHADRRDGIVTVAMMVATLTLQILFDPLVRTPAERWSAAFWEILPFLAWVIGLATRGWRLNRLLSQEAAATSARQAQLVAEERARIARELHDVVAHHVSVVVLQSIAAQGVLGPESERAQGPLEEIERSGREAAMELRRLLGVLRAEDEAPLVPQPGFADLPALVDGVRRAGLTASLSVEGQPPEPSAGLALTLFRLVQEALTNVLKHASAHAVDVSISYGDRAATVEVSDDGLGPSGEQGPPGHGLVGMQERVAVFGGTFEVGARAGGGYRMRAVLPYPDTA